MYNNLEQLEHDIWILRGRLNELRQQYPNMNEQVYKDRLNRLEFELHYMQEELNRMREVNPQLNNVFVSLIPPNKLSGMIPVQNMNSDKIQNKPIRDISVPPVKKEKRDLEKTFGTGIMGIIASILVFISIIIFGTLLIPYLSDVAMVLLMFFVSLIIAGIGLFLLHKNQTNKFHLSFCACGVTAICVSIFVTRILFGLIDNILFLVFISVWMAMMSYLCKKYCYLFRVIGEIGVLMTCILGVVEISFSAEWYFYLILVIFYGITSFVFHRIKPRFSYESNAFSHIIRTIAMIAFSAPIIALSQDFFITESIIMCITFIALIVLEGFMVWNENINHGILFYILSIIQMVLFSINASETFIVNIGGFILFSSVVLFVYFSVKQTKFNMIGDICVNIMYLFGGLYLLEDNIFITLVCVFPLLLYGAYRNRKIFLYGGLIGMSGIFSITYMTIIPVIMVSILPAILCLILARNKKDEVFTTVGYGCSLCVLAYGINEFLYEFAIGEYGTPGYFDFSYSESFTISFFILAILHIIIIKGNVLQEKGKIFENVSSIITAIMMFVSVPVIYDECFVVFAIFIALGLFVMNSKKMLEKSEKFGYYIAVKYTILMLIILDVSWDIAIIYSVCMLLFSLMSVLFGFKYNHKSFRIYGLLLSMISVFKLILFDVSGKSMTYNAFGFLVCGLICFGISFVYNKIEQKFNTKE